MWMVSTLLLNTVLGFHNWCETVTVTQTVPQCSKWNWTPTLGSWHCQFRLKSRASEILHLSVIWRLIVRWTHLGQNALKNMWPEICWRFCVLCPGFVSAQLKTSCCSVFLCLCHWSFSCFSLLSNPVYKPFQIIVILKFTANTSLFVIQFFKHWCHQWNDTKIWSSIWQFHFRTFGLCILSRK